MTGTEFSDAFDTLVNSYASNGNLGEQSSRQTPVFDEYEKSLFLTQAQEELVMSLYTGKNSYGESFESTEELREYLKVLINGTHKDLKLVEDIAPKQIVRYGNCKVYRVSDIASNIIGIIYEEVSFDDDSLGCKNGRTIPVIPVRHDEIVPIIDNPFRGPNDRRVIRIDNKDSDIKIELLSKYHLKAYSYYIKYLRRPNPIVVADLGDTVSIEGKNTISNYEGSACELPKQLHNRILTIAVSKALLSKGYNIQRENNN